MPRSRKLGYGEGTVYFEGANGPRCSDDCTSAHHGPKCPDDCARQHVHRQGEWRGEITIKGKRRRVSGSTKADAIAKLDELRSDVAKGLPTGDSMYLSEWIAWWLEFVGAPKENPSDGTRANYRWALAQAAPIGAIRLRDLKTEDVEKLLRDLSTRKAAKGKGRGGHRGQLGKSSLSRVRSALRAVLDEAVRRDMIARNVAQAGRLPSVTKTKRTRRSFTVEQAKKFLAATEGSRLEAMMYDMLYCGHRPGEATGLTWPRVDFKAKTLTIIQSRKVKPNGKMLMGPTKAKSDRIQRVPDSSRVPVLKKLREHQVRQKKERLVAPVWEKGDLVFCNEIGGPIDPSNLRRTVARLCKKAGVPSISPNELRHSAASLLADDGVPLPLIADFLGHATLRMVNETYRHKTLQIVDLTEYQEKMLGAD